MNDKDRQELKTIRGEFFTSISVEGFEDRFKFDDVIEASRAKGVKFEQTQDKSSSRCQIKRSDREKISAYNFYLNPENGLNYFFRIFVSEDDELICVDRIDMNKPPTF